MNPKIHLLAKNNQRFLFHKDKTAIPIPIIEKKSIIKKEFLRPIVDKVAPNSEPTSALKGTIEVATGIAF